MHLWRLLRASLVSLTRPKNLVAAFVMLALPVGIGAILRYNMPAAEFRAETVYNLISASMIFGIVLVLLSVVFGTSVITQEIEQKTIVYLLTRPVPRWQVLLAKYAAATIVTTVIAWIGTLLVAGILYGPGGALNSHVMRDLAILPIGAAAYGALFLLLAAVLNRPLMYGLLFAFGWESWVPQLPGSFQRLSLIAYLRVLAPHEAPDNSPKGLMGMMASLNPDTISSGTSWAVLLGVIVVGLAGACYLFSTQEYVPRDDAE
jgi:ABC-2 type transport system permease protein